LETINRIDVKTAQTIETMDIVDPITSHIPRLRDEETPPEGEIAELINERALKVEEIKQRYPYPEVENETI
jgi:hypothetical protein